MTSQLQSSNRVQSIDIIRGVVMVLMAIDHVRVYSGISAGSLEMPVFFTRWITHFCAPAFCFLAGTSIFLMESKIKDKVGLTKFLITRGLLLIFLELFLLRFFWTFNVNFFEFVLAGVIWMLGCCLVIMAGVIWLKSKKIVALIGLIIILGQELLSLVPKMLPLESSSAFFQFWKFIYPTGFENPQTDTVVVLYVIVPWIGVMALGYVFGEVLKMDNSRRRKLCIWIGSIVTLAFVLIATGQYFISDPSSQTRGFIVSILGQQKYPATPLFLMMTLGPMILLMPFVETVKGKLADVLNTIGRVPLFYYLAHILLIHISALVVQLISGDGLHQEWFDYAPFTFVPEDAKWSLATLYVVFIIDVAVLAIICRWYSSYKTSHPDITWLKYL